MPTVLGPPSARARNSDGNPDSPQAVHSALKDALRLGALSFDAVKHLVLCRLEGRPPRLDLELYPYLPRVRVNTTSARDYMPLLSGRAA